MKKILITGGPVAGKSTMAKEISTELGITHYCTDPQSMCDDGVTGTPDGLEWSETSQWISDNWICRAIMIEGVAIPRALRKWRSGNPNKGLPCDELIVLREAYKPLIKGQDSMKKGVMKVLDEVLRDWPELAQVTTFR